VSLREHRTAVNREQTVSRDTLIIAYLKARRELEASKFAFEIEWQEQRVLGLVSESEFLREYAWVVLCSGMKEANIRSIFPRISTAFCEWESAAAIVAQIRKSRDRALRVFRHPGKIAAIISSARWIATNGVDHLREGLGESGHEFLLDLPYMGPATAKHLAKNLGVNTGKPDRHLVRIAIAAGFDSPASLCKEVAEVTSHKESVIDIVLWRYATLHRDYVSKLTLRA
jgi:hypothetical protein